MSTLTYFGRRTGETEYAFSERLKCIILAWHYRDSGRTPNLYVVNDGEGTAHACPYAIRSDMINGLPAGDKILPIRVARPAEATRASSKAAWASSRPRPLGQ